MRLQACVAAWLLAAVPSLACADAQQTAATVCAACHGESGNSNVSTFPKLAGLQAEYLAKQLEDFVSGKRKNPAMAPFIANLKRTDVQDLAAYFAAQKPAPAVQGKTSLLGMQLYKDGNAASGVAGCAGCHQNDGSGNERFPRLAGQHQAYTLDQMLQFKSGARANDKARVMRSIAERLSESEIAALADYLAGL